MYRAEIPFSFQTVGIDRCALAQIVLGAAATLLS